MGKILKIQQPKQPETRTKVDFLFERAPEKANILSNKTACKVGSKSKQKPTF